MLRQGSAIGQPEPKKMRLTAETKKESSGSVEESGRERLTRHQTEMAGRVCIPDAWGHESFLKDWVDCTAFDSSLVPNGVVSARRALVEECRRANSRGTTIENRC